MSNLNAKNSLIGKLNNKIQKEYPELEDKTVNITANGETTVNSDEYYGLDTVTINTNVQQINNAEVETIINSGYPSMIFYIKKIPDLICNSASVSSMFSNYYVLEELPNITFNVACTNMQNFANSCQKIKSIPQYDTNKVKNFQGAFASCDLLENVPALDTSSATNFLIMFAGSSNNHLTDESLNNIMTMCINATSYTGTKTLQQLGITQTNTNRCKNLSNYQAFLNAGWTTGY